MPSLYLQRGYSGGYADDKFTGIERSFQSGSAVEVRRNPLSLTLAHALVSVFTPSGIPTCCLTLQTTGTILTFTADGRVYRELNGSGSPTQVFQDGSSRKIISAYEYNGYVYFTTSGHLHRITVANAEGTWTGNVAADYKAFAVGNTDVHPIRELFNKLYIGDSGQLAELDSFGVWTNNKLPIFSDEEIVALTFSGGLMRIFSRRDQIVQTGRVYFWDGVQDTYTEYIEWEGVAIHAAINKDGTDYVLAGKRPALYAASGYDKRKLKQIPLTNDSSSLLVAPNAMCVYEDLIVCGIGDASANALVNGAWTWGGFTLNYPDVLACDFPTGTSAAVQFVANCAGQLRIATSTTVYKIDRTKYATSGSITSRVYSGGDATSRKHIANVEASFKPLAAGESIVIQTRADMQGSFEDAITIAYSDTADRGVASKKRTIPLPTSADFNFLEVKATLTAGTSQLTTPELCDVTITFDPIQQ